MTTHRHPSCLLCLVSVLLLGNAGAAQTEQGRHSAPSDTASLGAFADSFFAREMPERRVPGAVVVVVRGGQVVLSRGYGYADVEARRTVDPERTLFRIGSVSKVVTATAAMQLVEQRRLELHRDVNDYLTTVRVPEAFGRPVTLHHLLTHTPGFEDRLTGITTTDPAAVVPLPEALRKTLPSRVRPPGEAISYSNHGTALVGLLVEEVSGLPLHEYARRYVQEPLGMERSGFRIPPGLEPDLATGYALAGGEYRRIPLDHIVIEPAGSFVATGTDMARFLLAHLGRGESQGRRVLDPETADAMHARQFSHHARVPGWAYGFYESARPGPRVLLHTGGTRDFRTVLFFLPAEGVGAFLSYNRADEGPVELQQAFMDAFLDRYFPAPDPSGDGTGEPGTAELIRTDHAAGSYRFIRHSRSLPEKILLLVYPEIGVRPDGAGGFVATGIDESPVRLLPAGGSLFRRDDGEGYVVFEERTNGTVARLAWGTHFPVVFERIAWWESVRVQLGSLLAMAVVFGSVLLRRPVAAAVALVRRTRRKESGPTSLDAGSEVPRRAWLVVGAASALNLLFAVAFPLAFFGRATGGWPRFMYGVSPLASALLVVPVLTAFLAAAALAFAVPLWHRRNGSLAERLHYSVAAFALVAFVAFAVYWNLFPWMV
jgi:CubicO group peptidase (beta-lactamase class C family)